MGTVFAHNAKAYNRWRQRRPAVVKRPPMSDAALEAAILRLALDNPGQVIREVRIV